MCSCRVEKNKDGTYTVYYLTKGAKEQSLRAAKVMFGTGRKPNTHGLGLEVWYSLLAGHATMQSASSL